MKFNQSYQFQSFFSSEDEIITIYLSLDTLSLQKPEFTVNIEKPIIFTSCLSIIGNLLADIPEIKFKGNLGYKSWYDKKILEIIEETTGLAKDKPDFMRELLLELEERKKSLEEKIKPQLNHFHKNKHKVVEMRKKKFYISKSYFGLILSCFGNKLFFEALPANTDKYVKIEITKGLQFDENIIPGTASVELSHQVIQDLFKIAIIDAFDEKKPLKLTTKKKRGDFVIPEIDRQPRKTIDLSPSWLYTMRKIKITEFFIKHNFNKLKSKEITLTRVELFDLLSCIKSSFGTQTCITIEFIHDSNSVKRKTIYARDGKIIIHKSEENKDHNLLRINGDVKLLLSLTSIIDQINQVKFIVLTKNLPHFIVAYTETITFTLGFNFRVKDNIDFFNALIELVKDDFDIQLKSNVENLISKNQHITFEQIQNTIESVNENQLFSIILELLSEGKVYFDSDRLEIFQHYLSNQSDFSQFLIDSPIDIIAGQIAKIIPGNIVKKTEKSTKIYSLLNFDFQPEIALNNDDNIQISNCTCQKHLLSSACEHVRALYVAMIMEGEL